MPIAELRSEQMLDYCRDHSQADSSLLMELINYTWENEDVPQIVINDTCIGGFEKLLQLNQSGKLKELLANS